MKKFRIFVNYKTHWDVRNLKGETQEHCESILSLLLKNVNSYRHNDMRYFFRDSKFNDKFPETVISYVVKEPVLAGKK
jgi:hypothetical protein